MTTLLFYKKPVILNRDFHKGLRIYPGDSGFSFSATTNAVPLACVEFPDAVRDYPIVFINEDKESAFPLALVGLRQDENLMVEADGKWDAFYVPAFVRRYPFVLQEKQDAEDFTVLIDEEYVGLGKDKGEPLFTEEGQDTPLLTQTLQFLSNFQSEVTRTRAFVKKLQELDLLIPRVIQVNPKDKSAFVLQGFSVVDETRLVALSDEDLLELARSGFLAWIYAHLISLGNVAKLHQKLEDRIKDAVAAA